MKGAFFRNKWLWFFLLSHLGGWISTNIQTQIILKEIKKAADLIMHQLRQKD